MIHTAAVPAARTISGVRVRGFRSIVDLTVDAGPLCALVGVAQSGKSNLLAALDEEDEATDALDAAGFEAVDSAPV